MSDLTIFVLEADINDLSDRHLGKIEEILLRTQKSALAQIDDANSALAVINDIRKKRYGDGKPPVAKKPPPPKK